MSVRRVPERTSPPAQADSNAEVLASGLLCGVGHAYGFPILFALVVGRARDAERGTAIAIYTGLTDLGMVMGGPIFGLILQYTSYTALYSSAAGILVVGSAVFLAWDRRAQRTARERRSAQSV